MVVTIEIGGILERKLRRLAEMGLYASVAEAVREAVRSMLQSLDLRSLALELYVSRGSTLHYAAEFADETFRGFIDYLLERGVTPSIGAVVPEDYEAPRSGVLVVDALTAYTLYSSGLADLLSHLSSEGYVFEAPSAIESQLHLLDAWRIRRGFRPVDGLALADIRVPEEEPRDMLATPLEAAVLSYSAREGAVLLSDDYRLRQKAREMGVEARSSLSLVTMYIRSVGEPPASLPEIVMSARAIPLLIPRSALEAWGVD
ncbi:hypothetical protein [Aeropyrum camini]|uniref:Uncharacterized protein n=1 Tax=Aeropyrum camini SY1 = JCM 12091 TaxID=1198449 RepID=U3TD28_9CREN|nr:hypothetical protein [Aeropyrum camini]BAN89935.1 hypothetical protein ACAM_0466 [Aeropyrum camini SY1 = JCM 12091]